MKIVNLEIKNYRSMENVKLSFPSFYTALCGRNDSGKTNVLKAIRSVIKEEDTYFFREEESVSFKDDFPKWNSKEAKDRQIEIKIEIEVNKNSDEGLYQFLVTYLSLEHKDENLCFSLRLTFSNQNPDGNPALSVAGKEYDKLKAEEVLNKLRSSHAILFHNSTEPEHPYRSRRQFSGFLSELSGGENEQLESTLRTINRQINRTAKRHQKELEKLLGRLDGKYRVGLSFPKFEVGYLPFTITLGDGAVNVELDDWGSGTRNRTLILMTLFKARKISESATAASKITPVIVIEEPESFLHPSGQAEFGRVIQTLCEEFKIQVIATTHSPYMLSHDKPESNILLERRVGRNKLRETNVVDTSGENWMRPFGLSLGIDNHDFAAWHRLFFNNSHNVLLVEGEIDKEYFELLRDVTCPPKTGPVRM